MPNPIQIAEIAQAAGRAAAPLARELAEEAAQLLGHGSLAKSGLVETGLTRTGLQSAGTETAARKLAINEALPKQLAAGEGGRALSLSEATSRAAAVPNPYLAEFNALQKDPSYRRAIDIARGRIDSSSSEYSLAFRQQREMRYGLTNKYAWAVPNQEALATIAAEGRVVEAGAGSGYWASLLRAMKTDVIAFDKHGTDLAANHFHKASPVKAWTDIARGDAAAVKPHGDRSLFMSFPPHDEPFAYDVLKNYRGNRFVYVGEGPGGVTGDDKFFNLLAKRWKEEKTVAIPNWEASDGFLRDALTVYVRR